jgi:gluconolactonase
MLESHRTCIFQAHAALWLVLVACHPTSRTPATAPSAPVTSQATDATPIAEDDDGGATGPENMPIVHSRAGSEAAPSAAAHSGGGAGAHALPPLRTATDAIAGAGRDGSAGEPVTTAGAAAPMTTPTLANDGLPAAESFPAITGAMFGTPTLIAADYELSEGPLWDPCEERLLFSDVNARRIYAYTPGAKATVYVERTNYVNGMIFDREGGLLLAEMGGGYGGRITRMGRDKQVEVLVDRDPNGNRLRTSDDLTLHSNGTIYFSDPEITHGLFVSLSVAPSPFYRLSPGPAGMRSIVKEGQGRGTNGIRLTRDMKTLLVSEYSAGKLSKYTVLPDGSVEDAGDLITDLTSPDSMCLDLAGNVYIGVSTGIQVVRQDGSKVALLRVGSNTTNCAFGGPDGKTLFITAWSKLLSLENMPVPGLAWAQDKRMKCF